MLRILDANFNRAREALRVLEDQARFELEDARLSAELKALRHDLDALSRPLAARLLAARDSRDVGRDSDVAGPRDVVAANFKRAEEAARSIEEHAGGAVRSGAHRIRFRLYALEPRMRGPRARVAKARLYVLLDSSVAGRPLTRVAQEALRGGAEMLQLREEGGDRKLLGLAQRLAELAHAAGALFLVNDRADLAVASGADGVHVGGEDLPIAAAREVVGGARIVGATTHSLSEARAAAGADYISVGPMFPTATKAGLAPRGFSYLEAAKRLGIPHFCIGGITASNASPRMVRVAACAGIVAQPDVAAAARAIRRQLTR
jgi:thiamine-phosphate pyrophosphorylase